MPVRILVVDDEPAITALISDMLAYAGFEVVQANGGAEAITAARRDKPDLVLLDVMMPDLDGRDVCRAIKMDQELQNVPVVLFSSADEQDVSWRAAGADAFLQKPFRIHDLPAYVRRILERTGSTI